jgi:CRP/FNR family cyclic AMP-dependent transcriptional regulator
MWRNESQVKRTKWSDVRHGQYTLPTVRLAVLPRAAGLGINCPRSLQGGMAVKLPDAQLRRAALMRAEMFQSLQPADIDAILERSVVRRVARGTTILRRGDQNGGMVILLSGRARVSVVSEDGKEATLAVLDSGEVLGELSLLDGQEVSADVTAQEDCRLMQIERAQFLDLLRRNSGLSLALMAVLSRRVRRTNAALEDMALLDLPSRLGRLLARLAKDCGSPVRTGTRIEVKLSQKDLSTLVGASREKVNRQLRQWEESGYLSKDNGRVVVVDAQALAPPQ